MTAQYSWYEFYKTALLETDWTKMPERIQAAESEIKKRRASSLRVTAKQQKNGTPSPTPLEVLELEWMQPRGWSASGIWAVLHLIPILRPCNDGPGFQPNLRSRILPGIISSV